LSENHDIIVVTYSTSAGREFQQAEFKHTECPGRYQTQSLGTCLFLQREGEGEGERGRTLRPLIKSSDRLRFIKLMLILKDQDWQNSD